MTSELLETKLRMPTTRRSLVGRPRLIERLGRGQDRTLTLVSASAGFGKTTLLTEWLAVADADQARAVAWLSLDASDSDPATFWTYLVAALRTAAPGVGDTGLALLQSQAPTDAVVASLINDMSAVTRPVVLVLDDYHVIDEPAVHDGMTFLLDHLPRQLHLVVASRADPPFPLARLRARGEMVEIRAADLRFTPEEAAAYLNGAMGLTLTSSDVATLEARTEGWIAALQLAALSMQGRESPTQFIDAFAGDDRFIVDYLIEEVLQRQTDEVKAFLLRTSLLDGLSGSLCDAVTGRAGGKAMLEALERANLFVVPLDDRRQWYRYHHLFGDVLRARLLDEDPDLIRVLHQRASIWYDKFDDLPEAMRHAVAGEDFDHAADLLERMLPALRQARQEVTMRRWLAALPEEIFVVRPVLSAQYAGSLMVMGEMQGVEARLQAAERWLVETGRPDGEPTAPSEMVVVDQAAFRALPTAIEMFRAALALLFGDLPGTMAHATRALQLVGEDDYVGRGGPSGLLSLAHWTTGDVDTAHGWSVEAVASLEKGGHIADVAGCAIAVADIELAQGRLRDAQRTCERVLRLTTEEPGTPVRGTADMHVALGRLLLERNDLDGARAHLRSSAELGEHGGMPQNRYRWRVGMAELRTAEGDLDGAVELLDDAQRVYVADFFPEVRPISAMKARVRLAQGRLGDAQEWARERGLAADDDLSYLREFEHITLARLLVAQHANDRAGRCADEALALLDRLRRAAEDAHRMGSVLDILIARALAHQARGDLPAAVESLTRALSLAEPEGYVRLFVGEGPPTLLLLAAAANTGPASAFARRLLTSVGAGAAQTPDQRRLVEPLSARELDVLRLLASDLNGPDIARHLVVSLNTVRTHTKSIFSKLGVNNRREAVSRAGELGLLSRNRGPQP